MFLLPLCSLRQAWCGTGGVAYVYNKDGSFKDKCNMGMIELEELKSEDEEHLRSLLSNHSHYTQSPAAKRILNEFHKEKNRFIKVMPTEYKRILKAKNTEEKTALSEVSDG